MIPRSISPGRAARELIRRELTGDAPPPPPFSLAAFVGDHVKQSAFVNDKSHRVHAMCARQSGKSQGDDGILMDAGLFLPYSTNLILGLNGPAIRNNNWEPIWKRLFDRFSGLDPKWRNETRMLTTFPNGARVFMGGSDDARHIKNLLGGRIENGVVIIDECFPAGTLVDGRPIETIRVGDITEAVDHVTGRLVSRRVVRVFQKTSSNLVRVSFEGGSFVCTGNHPVFIKDKGYTNANDTRIGDLLCVRRANKESFDVLGGVPVRSTQSALDREHLAYGRREREDGSRKARREPDGESCRAREDVGHAAADWARTKVARGEWTWANPGRDEVVDCDRMAHQRGREDGPLSRRVGVSDLLQAGSGGRINQDMYRGRWSEPREPDAPSDRREEDEVLEWARVESVSRLEPGSSGGTPVYNLEVEGAHTYFANGALVHNCQDQAHVLDELLDSILPPMMGMGARLILSGVFPEVPAGRFWRESGWVERGGTYIQEPRGGWSTHNWGRLANIHTPDARAVLDRYLADTGLTEDHPQIQRDWFGRPAFDPTATAYHYRLESNGYTAVLPEWLRETYGSQKDRGRDLVYAHPMRLDKDGARYGLMAAEPFPGVDTFSLALDPGANADRASIQGWGWGSSSQIVQHVFDWSSPRGARLSTGQMFAILGLAYARLGLHGGPRGGVVKCRYDAGSSQNTIDNLQGDYGIPVVLAAKKTDLKGQVDRNNDLLDQGRAKVMIGSALEQDYQRARWDKAALAAGSRSWAPTWHPDPSEAARYALQDYYDAYEAPPPPPKDDTERHREAIRAELADIARQESARGENDGDPLNW